MFIEQINKQRPRQQSQNNCESLGSISAVVTNNEDRTTLAEDSLVASDDENSSESATDDKEHECVVCRLEFAGESKLEQHRRIAQHWGYEIMQEREIKIERFSFQMQPLQPHLL